MTTDTDTTTDTELIRRIRKAIGHHKRGVTTENECIFQILHAVIETQDDES